MGSTANVNVGVWNSGRPSHGAALMPEVSTSPRTSASTYPAKTAMKIASRPMMPRKNASVATNSTRVTMATSGPFSKFDFAAGARLKPIRATIAPVTTGGNVASIQCVPTRCTTAPMTISARPTATRPPSALPVPFDATAAVTGAITEKLDPR